MTAIHLVILILATWRISSLLSNEMGPGDIIEKIRYKLGVRYDERSERFGKNIIAKAILCQWCNTLYIGIVLVIVYLRFGHSLIYILSPFAISTGAIWILVSRPMIHYTEKMR